MKKIVFIGLLMAMSGIAITSCEDERDKGLEPDKVYLSRRGVIEESTYDLGETVNVSLWADKSGAGKQSARITYMIDESLLTELAAIDPSQSYTLLPGSCYTLPSQMTFDMAAGDEYAKFGFTYDPAAIVAADGGVYRKKSFALPIRIKVEGEAAITNEIDEAPDYAIMVFDIKKPVINFLRTELTDLEVTLGATDMAGYSLPVGMDFTNKWNVSFTLETNPVVLQTAVDAYNAEKGTNMKLLTPDAVVVDAVTATLPEGVMETDVWFDIDKSKVEVGASLLPLILTDVSSPLQVGDVNTAYLVVRGVAERLSRDGWTATAHTSTGGHEPAKIIDGEINGSEDFNLGNYYHVIFKAPNGGYPDQDPWVTIDMGKEETVAQVEIYPRYTGIPIFTPSATNTTANEGTNVLNNIFGYQIFTSNDGNTWTQRSANILFAATLKKAMIDLDEAVDARYVKVQIDAPGRRNPTNKNGGNTVGIMEVYLRGF